MAISKMLSFRLVGVSVEEDRILDVLAKTGAVHVGKDEIPDGYLTIDADVESLRQKHKRLLDGLEFLKAHVDDYAKTHDVKDFAFPTDVDVSYTEFFGSALREKTVLPVIERLEKINENIISYKSKLSRIQAEKTTYLPFINLDSKFSVFNDTEKTSVFLGIIPSSKLAELESYGQTTDFVEVDALCPSTLGTVVSVICLKQSTSEVLSKLYSLGYINSGFRFDYTAKEKTDNLNSEYKMIEDFISQAEEEIFSLKDFIRDIEILADFYLYETEKTEKACDFARTNHSFILKGYVPVAKKDEVENAVLSVSKNVYTEFTEVKDDEFAPTLCENNKMVKPFESITDSFSTPKYGSIDPNPVLAFFFAVFMGFITADLGYGILMTVVGFIISKGKKETGLTKLAKVFAWSGIPTMIFGILFDSFFGFQLLQNLGILQSTILPDPVEDKVTVAGITVPVMILISLGMGVIQIMASLVLKGILETRRGNFFDGLVDGYAWTVFLGGLMCAIVGMINGFDTFTKVSLIVSLAFLAIGVIFAGRHEKSLGKFTKSFSAVYGLINYMSDILSYVRLYGLMLSGAQIGSIFTNILAIKMLFPMGFVGIVFGIIVIILGHTFNIAMGLLGAYIHDSRLQYIEFFGRFFEGEGERFSPLGSRHDFITTT